MFEVIDTKGQRVALCNSRQLAESYASTTEGSKIVEKIMEKVSTNDIGGEVVKEDERYVVKDNKLLKNLMLSSTKLNPNMSTSGHDHKGQEEVYMFVEGHGTMELDQKTIDVKKGDIVLIQDGVYHKVHAADLGCEFICVFDGQRYDHVAVLGYD